ncbi:Fic family protein [Nesterenkonia lacusekhoensis]|uniref:Fic family protein n=1 Tax=Nesterenkonia lacusekhoensis TaxID=150832 RepID=A0ABS4T231_9MICC|nr:Fic family protein [Nesterenkonia lacusekhoensis]
MKPEQFSPEAPGTLRRIQGVDPRTQKSWETHAFLPHDLPLELTLNPDVQLTLGKADRALGGLNAFLSLIPNPQWLVRPSLSREAVSTSALEGTYASLEEVMEADYLDEKASSAQVREVRNYLDAADRSLELLKTRPVSRRLLEELQLILVKGTRGEAYDSGQIRQRQVFIGGSGRSVQDARFVPPPPGEALDEGISSWEKWINTAERIHPLVRVALGHYQFETLHPFSDGNGRIGRLVVTLQLIDQGLLDYPVLNLASWLEPRRDEYIDLLLAVSQTGAVEEWLTFFLRGVAEQAEATTNTMKDLLALRESMLNQLREAKDRSIATRIAGDLIETPIFDVAAVARRYEVTHQAASNAVRKLTDLNLVEQVGQSDYKRLYISRHVMEILNSL